MVTSPSVPRDIGLHPILVPFREPAREGRAPLAPEPGQQGDAGPEPHGPRARQADRGEREGGGVAADRGPPQNLGLAVPEPASPPAPRHARHQRRPTSARSSSRKAPPSASAGPRIATILLVFSANSAISSARPPNLRRRPSEADHRSGGSSMPASLLGRSIIPCTV